MFVRPAVMSVVVAFSIGAAAQDAVTSVPVTIPHVLKYTVALPPGNETSVRIELYAASVGGDPLWSETERVTPDASGKTVLLLGSATDGGIPQSVFAAAEARYVGTRIGDAQEAPRTLLAPSAYALKAADADTLGGHPVSDFALAGKLKPDTGTDVTQINTSAGILGAGTGPTVSLTADPAYFNTYYGQLAAANAFTASNSFAKPILSTVATGTAPFTVASTTAVPNLDASLLGGAAAAAFPQLTLQNTFTNNQIIGPSAPATTSTGHSSYFLWMNASVWNSSKNAAQNIGFQWRAEPLDNDTAAPNANFALLSTVTSATPQETGFKITANGVITFVAAQTFPGTGTITGVTASTGLVGGGTTGTVSLGIDPAYTSTLATLSGANYFTGINTFSGPIASVVATGAAPFSIASTTVVPNLNASYVGGVPATNIATLNGTNQFVIDQTLAAYGGAAATTSAGVSSSALDLSASSYLAGTGPKPETFILRALPTNNDTSSPGALLDFEYSASGGRPVDTGLTIGSNGVIAFASGQTFPGAGTITGVTAGTGLSGGGTSGAVTLALNTAYLNINYSSLNAADTYSAAQTVNSTETITGSAADQLTVSTTASSGTAIDGYSSSGTGVYGVTSTGTGVYGYASGSNATGVRAYSASGTGITSTGLTAVSASGSTASGGVGVNATGLVGVNATGSSSSGGYGVTATGAVGVYATSASGGPGIQAAYTGTSSAGNGLSATSADGDGVYAIGSVYGISAGSFGGTGVYGYSSTATGIQAQGATFGLTATSPGGTDLLAAVKGTIASASTTGSTFPLQGGVWGDTAATTTNFQDIKLYAGVVGTADDSYGALFLNNSSLYATVAANNDSTDTGSLLASFQDSQDNDCEIQYGGVLSCTGGETSVVKSQDRQVETYTMSSAENWIEDFGSASLVSGHVQVPLEQVFRGAVNTEVEYHVYLTPAGECEGLYVAQRDGNGFEVRELHHGTSNAKFDYRIVAKRRGREADRLVDVTEKQQKHIHAAKLSRTRTEK